MNQPKIIDLLEQKKTKGIEVFPPRKPEHLQAFLTTVQELSYKNFEYINITSKLQQNFSTEFIVEKILKHSSKTLVPHILTHGVTKKQIRTTMTALQGLGISNVLVIRGDTSAQDNEFVSVLDMVRYIKENYPDFCIGVSCYPEGYSDAYSIDQELEYLSNKIACGADYLVTQFFFDAGHFIEFVKLARKSGIYAPIMPGLTVVRDAVHIQHLAKLSKKPLFIPQKLLQALGKEQITYKGLEYALQLIHELLPHSSGIHLYTFNTVHPFDEVLDFLSSRIDE